MSSDDEEVFTEARGDILPTMGGDTDPDDPPALRTEGNPDPKIEKKRKLEIAAEKAGMMMWGGDEDDDTPPVPKFGGMVRIKNNKPGNADEIFAWSGTDPDAETVMMYSWSVALKGWTIDVKDVKKGGTRIQGPTREGMYRPRGVKQERVTKEHCITYGGMDKFNGVIPIDGQTTIPLSTFKDVMRQHMIENGMIDTFLLKDPRDKTTVRDLFRHHAMMPADWVQKEVVRLKKYHDIYIDQNLKWSAEYIRNSITPDLLTKLLHEVTLETSGPETFISLMRLIHSDSYEALEKIKDKLLALELKNFAGEDIRSMNVMIRQYAEQLECGDHFTPELIPKICMKYENANDMKFSQWATTTLYEPALRQVKDLRVMDKSVLSYSLITVDSLIRMTNTRYDDALAAGRYTSAVTSKDPDVLPAGYLAKMVQDEVTKTLKQVQFHNKSDKGTGGGGTRGTNTPFDGTCNGCGAQGVRQSDCTTCTTTTTTSPEHRDLSKITVNGTVYNYNSPDWKQVAPTTGQPLQIRHGSQRYRYCTDCVKWCYHYGGDAHNKWKARKQSPPAAANASPAPAATPVANLALVPTTDSGPTDDESWQFGFAGMRI